MRSFTIDLLCLQYPRKLPLVKIVTLLDDQRPIRRPDRVSRSSSSRKTRFVKISRSFFRLQHWHRTGERKWFATDPLLDIDWWWIEPPFDDSFSSYIPTHKHVRKKRNTFRTHTFNQTQSLTKWKYLMHFHMHIYLPLILLKYLMQTYLPLSKYICTLVRVFALRLQFIVLRRHCDNENQIRCILNYMLYL